MHVKNSAGIISLLVVLTTATVAGRAAVDSRARVPTPVLLQIIRAEDERRWDDILKKLLGDQNPQVRKRAALAAGRIGNEGAVPILAEMLLTNHDNDVRQMAAFALGEIESPGGAYALLQVVRTGSGSDRVDAAVRARAVEALGKIVAALIANAPADTSKPAQTEDDRLDIIRAAIVDALRFENSRRSQSDRLTILLALTAVLRAKPDGVGKLIAKVLDYADPRIVADALNTLARLRLKDGNDEARELLVKHADPIVRANAARVLGVTEDKQAFDALLDRALHDSDLRVRVSAIRALGSLKDALAVNSLTTRGWSLLKTRNEALNSINELLEISTAIGRLLPNTYSKSAQFFFDRVRGLTGSEATESEVAYATMAPVSYRTEFWPGRRNGLAARWSRARVQALAAVKQVLGNPPEGSAGYYAIKDGENELRTMATNAGLSTLAVSDALRSFASFKPKDLNTVLMARLSDADVIVRATAVELLGEEPPNEMNARALIEALPRAMRDVDNDAALAILDALAKQKSKEANDAIKTALDSKDHLIRRRAVALLKANGVGDFSDRIGTVQTRNTEVDYRRAIARVDRKPTATVVTSNGSFTIEFLPEDAPLTVDNFIKLAEKGYFNGQTIPRVVPNFVVQAGDPRGGTECGPR